MSNTLRFGSSRNDNLWIECLISHAKNTTDNDCLYSEKYPGRIVLLNDADEWAVDIQNRLEDLEQENATLQHHLDSKIDQCVRLEMQLNKRTVKVTTEFGSDIVAAPPKTVDVKGKPCVEARCKGTYQEAGIQDDMHGNLHCTACGQRVKRHQGDR